MRKEDNNADLNDRLILASIAQFLQFKGYKNTLKSLLQETTLIYSFSHLKKELIETIKNADWRKALDIIVRENIQLSKIALSLIHGELVIELCQKNEFEAAKEIFLNSTPISLLKENKSFLYNNMLQALSKKPYKKASDSINLIVQRIEEEIFPLEKDNLLKVFSNSLKFQDLNDKVDMHVDTELLDKAIKGDKKDERSISFSNAITSIKVWKEQDFPDFKKSSFLIFGSKDGFIEFWDPNTCKLDLSFSFQKEDRFLVHENEVVALKLNRKGNMLLSMDNSNCIKAWDIFNEGSCLISLENKKEIISSFCFLSSNNICVCNSKGFMNIFGLKSRASLNRFETNLNILEIEYLNGNIGVVTPHSFGYIKYKQGNQIEKITNLISDSNEVIVKGKILHNHIIISYANKTVKVFKLDSNATLIFEQIFENSVRDFDICPRTKNIVVSFKESISVYSLSKNEIVKMHTVKPMKFTRIVYPALIFYDPSEEQLKFRNLVD